MAKGELEKDIDRLWATFGLHTHKNIPDGGVITYGEPRTGKTLGELSEYMRPYDPDIEKTVQEAFAIDEQRRHKMETFYMVYVEGQSAPVHKHRTLREATREAERLAKLNSDFRVFVLKALYKATISAVQWEQLVGGGND